MIRQELAERAANQRDKRQVASLTDEELLGVQETPIPPSSVRRLR